MQKKKNARKSRGFRIKVLIELLVILLLFAAIFSYSLKFSRVHSVNVLAVSEAGEDELKGTIARIYLELKPGKGRVFIDSSPLTKPDLQMSIRYSRDLACEFLSADCGQYDFLYTIDSGSFLIGGPSAGMALTLLTISALENIELDEGVAITGTINSGYLSGPVAGVTEKIEATASSGIEKILIPSGQSLFVRDNVTVNLTGLAESLSKELFEVRDIYDVLRITAGRDYEEETDSFTVNQRYIDSMRNVASALCSRTRQLFDEVSASGETDNVSQEILNKSLQSLDRSDKAFSMGAHYSAASFCFSANSELFFLKIRHLDEEELLKVESLVSENLDFIESSIDREFSTLGDIQIKGAVFDRVRQSRESLELFRLNRTSRMDLAYSFERLFSAEQWSSFFGLDTRRISIDHSHLKSKCIDMVYELDVNYDYLGSILPHSMLESIDYGSARKDLYAGRYDLCIFNALRERASMNVLSTYLFHTKEMINITLENKLRAALIEIAKQEKKGSFPFVAYSYYEYAGILKEQGDIYSSVLFSEFAIELSKMDAFLTRERPGVNLFWLFIILFGIIVGAILNDIIFTRKRK
ncbi:MAG TPA: hypothetical protein ENN46_00140 [Candidatus Woesearchaeota archaeon]|nr:hypothetical protein [Candidatus Woesearchaeota archaeon]